MGAFCYIVGNIRYNFISGRGSRLLFFCSGFIFLGMLETTRPLNDVHETALEMRRLCEKYYTDLGAWLSVPLIIFYRHVCALPYVADPVGVETVSRPAYTLRPEYTPRDCDDKSVLIASWLHGNGIKKRFISTSCRPDRRLTHVFVQLENGLFVDPTYKKYSDCLGNYPYFPRVTRCEELTGLF